MNSGKRYVQEAVTTISNGIETATTAVVDAYNYVSAQAYSAYESVVAAATQIKCNAQNFVENIDWGKMARGAFTVVGGAILVAGMATIVVATGGAAIAAVPTLLSIGATAVTTGVVTGGMAATAITAAITIGTTAAAAGALVTGVADVVEGLDTVKKGLFNEEGSGFNFVRDTIFEGNEDSYYLMQAVLSQGAYAGYTAVQMSGVLDDKPEQSTSTESVNQGNDSEGASEGQKTNIIVSVSTESEDAGGVQREVETPINSGNARPDKTSTANSVYEQINPDGSVKSRTFYDENGNQFSRQDFDHTHFDKNTQQDYQPHEHNYSYNSQGQRNGDSVIALPDGYTNEATK